MVATFTVGLSTGETFTVDEDASDRLMAAVRSWYHPSLSCEVFFDIGTSDTGTIAVVLPHVVSIAKNVPPAPAPVAAAADTAPAATENAANVT